MPLHHHPAWEISWIVTGSGHRLTGGTLEVCRTGEVILVPPELPHGWMFEDTGTPFTENITVQFPENTLATAAAFPELNRHTETLKSLHTAVEITGEAADEIRMQMTYLSEAGPAGRLLRLIGMVPVLSDSRYWRVIGDGDLPDCRTPGQNPFLMEAVYSYILAHYGEKIPLSAIADTASMSETAFCSFFKRNAGETFSSFLNRFRVKMASKMLLLHPDLPIADIAFRCGFNDIPHFHRMFRRYAGLTPGSLRKGKHGLENIS